MVSNNVQRILQSTAWVSLHTGLYRIVTLAIAVLSARLLDVEGYGKISILQSTSALFIMLATMGMGTVATKLVAEHDGKYVPAIGRVNLLFCVLSSAAVFLGKDFLASYVYQDATLSNLIGWLALFILFSGITQVQTGILAGKEAYRTISSVNLSVGLVSIGGVFAGIYWLDVTGWVVALTTAELIKAWVLSRQINKILNTRKDEYVDISVVLKPAIPIALSGLFILPVNWYVIRELLLTNGYFDVALMNIADQWIAVLTFFPIALGNAMLPIMAKMGQGSQRINASNKALKLNVLLALLASLPIALLADWVLTLYGSEYVNSTVIFWWIVPLVIVLSMTNQLNNRVIADGKANAMLFSNILWMIICLPASLVFLGLNYGIVGILVGRLCGYLAKLMYLLYVSSQK